MGVQHCHGREGADADRGPTTVLVAVSITDTPRLVVEVGDDVAVAAGADHDALGGAADGDRVPTTVLVAVSITEQPPTALGKAQDGRPYEHTSGGVALVSGLFVLCCDTRMFTMTCCSTQSRLPVVTGSGRTRLAGAQASD